MDALFEMNKPFLKRLAKRGRKYQLYMNDNRFQNHKGYHQLNQLYEKSKRTTAEKIVGASLPLDESKEI